MLPLKLLGIINLLFHQVLCDQKPLFIDKLRWDFLQLENDMWNLSSNGFLYKDQNESEIYLAKKFYDFDRELTKMPDDILRGLDPLRTIPDFLFLYSELKVIENKYEKFQEYQKGQINQSTNKVMMEDMIYDILSNNTGIKKSIDQVQKLSVNIGEELLEMINRNVGTYQQSAQQLMYNFYNVIALTELKAYVMQQFAYLGNRLWDKGNNIELSILTRKNYEKRINGTIGTFRNIFPIAPKDIWRCDPKNYVRGQTFEEFTRLLQGHVQNEVDMTKKGTCRHTCSDYSYAKSYGCYDYQSEFCRKVEKCNGNIIGCYFVESHATICLAPKGSSRRYDYVKYNSGKTLGKQHACAVQKHVNSWQRWFVRCHYCMCLCDEHGLLSDRYINLRPVLADIRNNRFTGLVMIYFGASYISDLKWKHQNYQPINKPQYNVDYYNYCRVVTGLRLIKHNRLLHLQIQEGKLLPYGYIDESTVHWVPVDDYRIKDSGVKSGEDFFTMTYEHRSMAVDEIEVHEDNHVVTGVRFENISNIVHFEIHVSPFDWQNGAVQENNGYYIYETNPNGRSKISLSNADVPFLTNKPSEIRHSYTNSYVEFTHTDFNKDAAQTTIPFIDTQEVINTPAVPLMGAGIYYKGNAGFGGFIAPRIKTYDYGKHISNLVPKMGDRVDISDDVFVEVN